MTYNIHLANDGKHYRVPKRPVWRIGPPPSIGWWPASRYEWAYTLRWWDGKHWSNAVRPSDSEHRAAAIASRCTTPNNFVQWTYKWWEEK